MAGPQKEIYLLQRDKVESARYVLTLRENQPPKSPKNWDMTATLIGPFWLTTPASLNWQHNFLLKICGGSPIHVSVPKDRLFSIADVATGTGVWMRDVSDVLKEEYPSDKPRYFHGFDISDAQFPADRGSFDYSVHDCLKPFPAEHHNRYDLVHVRLLVSGMKEAEYKTVVANLVPLLKPGGYLQWEDLDLYSFVDYLENLPKRTLYFDHMKFLIGTQVNMGIAPRVPESVYEAAKSAGLLDVVKYDYSTADHPDLATTTQDWVFKVVVRLIPTALVRSGQVPDEETAKEKAQKYIDDIERLHAEGIVPNGGMGMVVARKG